MSINAGTIAAFLTLDTNKFTSAMSSARSQLKALKDDGLAFSDKMTAVGGALTTVGGSLTKNVTLPLASAGVVCVKFASDFETSSAKVETIADTTVRSMDELNDGILKLSTNTGIAADELNESLYQVISATGDTANALDYVEIANMAAVGGFTDTATAVDGLTTVMNAYGLKGGEAMQNISDQMLMAQNYGKTTFGELASSIGNVIPLAATLNIGTDELFASLATLTKQGIGTSEAVTGMKAAFSNILKPSADAAKLAEELGLDFSATALESKGLAGFLNDVSIACGGDMEMMSRLFGSTEALNTVLALTSEQGAADMQGALAAMADSAGATENAYETMADTFAVRSQKLVNSLKNVGIELGSELMPIAEEAVGMLSDVVGWFSDLDDSSKKFVVTAALIAAAAGPVITGVGRIVTIVGAAKKTFLTAKSAISAFTSACVAHPYIALGTAVLGAGVAFGTMAYKVVSAKVNYDSLALSMNGILSKAKEFNSEISATKSALDGTSESLYSSDSSATIENQISAIQKKITSITKLASDERRDLTQKEIQLLQDYYEELNALTEKQYGIYEKKLISLSVLVSEEGSMTTEKAKSYLAEAQSIRDQTIDTANQAYAEEAAILVSNYQSLEDFEENATQKERDRLAEAQNIRDQRIKTAQEQYSGIASAISESYALENVSHATFITSLSNYKKEIASIDEWSNALYKDLEKKNVPGLYLEYWTKSAVLSSEKAKATQKALDDLVAGIDSSSEEYAATMLYFAVTTELYGGEIDEKTRFVVGQLVDLWSILPDDAKESMRDTWLGMKEELAAGAPELYAAAEADANSIINAIDAALGIASPSRVMRERGRYAMQGLEQGMSDEKNSILSSLGGIMNEIKDKAQKLNLESAGTDAMEGLQRGMNKKKSSLLATAGNIANSISAKIRSALDIHSPSRVMAAIGSQVSAGLAVGMEDYSYEVRDAAENLAMIASTTVSASSKNNVASRIESISRPQNAENKIDKVINLLELLLAKEGDVVLDGRVMGRWIKTLS